MSETTAKALIIVTDFGVEEAELTRPAEALRDAGVEVTIASDSGAKIQTVEGDKDWSSMVEADTTIGDVDADDYDLLVIPGGTVNADVLRVDDDARALVSAFAAAGKTVAAICHGPWILIDAGVAAGKTLTSYPSLQLDLTNAGASWVDTELKECPANGWTLLTSRNPDDLDAFCTAITEAVGAGA